MISLKFISALLVPLLGAVLYYCLNLNVTTVTLTTTFGLIKGTILKSRDGREYHSYTGIPYALPPVGERRFQPSVPYGSWKESWDATQKPPICPQYDILWQKLDGQEDCLYLNVFTPVTKQSSSKNPVLLPVMVFIHGGHFMYGGSDIYGAQYFMDEDVVMVTLNYRVGALGFLNTGPEARGNMGLKDQTLALKWVQKAIGNFGGDPDSVTIMGESAGAASVNYHMISPYSDGLFHRAISQSGTAICPWAFVPNTRDQGKRLARKVGCPIGTVEGMMTCLRQIDVMKIVETQAEIKEIFHSHDATFGPSVEYDGGGKDDDIFIFDHPRDSVEDGQMARVPWMLGVVPQEGCFRSALIINNQSLLRELNNNWNQVLPRALIYDKDDFISKQIKEYYFGKANSLTAADYTGITDMFSDRYFFECTSSAAILHAPSAPTFLYDLTYKSGMTIAQARVAAQGNLPVLMGILWDYAKLRAAHWLGWEVMDYGVCHVDDVQFLFTTISLWEITPTSKHYAFSKDLVKLWVSFAKTGSPSKFRNVAWSQLGVGEPLKYLRLNENPSMIEDPFVKGVKFWKSLHV